MALIRPVGLVEQLFELPGDLLDTLTTLFHPAPGRCDAPTLGAGLGRLVYRVELELTAVVEDDDEVDKPVEASLPCCDAPIGVSGGVGDEVGGGETDGASEDGLVDCTRVAGHLGEDAEDELSIVGRVVLSLSGCERGCSRRRDGHSCMCIWMGGNMAAFMRKADGSMLVKGVGEERTCL